MMKTRYLLIAVLVTLLPGCVADQLDKSTVRQGTTMTELQYHQVLTNLAMFSQDPYTIPSHLTIKTGTTQVSDTGTASLGLEIMSRVKATPMLSGSRAIVDTWGTIPVTDDAALKLIRVAYQSRAIAP